MKIELQQNYTTFDTLLIKSKTFHNQLNSTMKLQEWCGLESDFSNVPTHSHWYLHFLVFENVKV